MRKAKLKRKGGFALDPKKKGLFGAKAKAAGKSTAEYADEEYNAPGALGKEARFAYNAEHGKFGGKKK